ncbi:hypothetical protein ABPG72_017508 [Tetrahymena utriculariae]
MDNIDQKKLEEEEEKLNLLKDDLEYANEEKGLQEEIFYFLQEQFQEELEEQQKYLDLEKEYEDIIDALQNELNDENQVHQEKQQDLDNTNLLIEQNMREEQQEIAISQLCKRDKELASQERQKLQSEIIIIMQNIAELKEKEKKIEQQKKEKEEKQITMNKLIGLVTFAVRFVCPIQAALVGLAGVFFSNVDYFGASEKLKLDEKKQKQEELSKRQSDLEQISEEKYQKSLKSAQSKSQSILKGLTTKKDVENKLQNLRNNMLDQSNKIQQMVQKKTQCSNFAQKIEQKYQDTLPRLQELRANLQNNSYADIIQKITLQQQVVKNLKANIEKKSNQKYNQAHN